MRAYCGDYRAKMAKQTEQQRAGQFSILFYSDIVLITFVHIYPLQGYHKKFTDGYFFSFPAKPTVLNKAPLPSTSKFYKKASTGTSNLASDDKSNHVPDLNDKCAALNIQSKNLSAPELSASSLQPKSSVDDSHLFKQQSSASDFKFNFSVLD